MKGLLPIELWCLALNDARRWIPFRLPIIGVTAQQIWLCPDRMASTPMPGRRIPRGYLHELGPWSPTIWIGPALPELVAAALASWEQQAEVAQRHADDLADLHALVAEAVSKTETPA